MTEPPLELVLSLSQQAVFAMLEISKRAPEPDDVDTTTFARDDDPQRIEFTLSREDVKQGDFRALTFPVPSL